MKHDLIPNNILYATIPQLAFVLCYVVLVGFDVDLDKCLYKKYFCFRGLNTKNFGFCSVVFFYYDLKTCQLRNNHFAIVTLYEEYTKEVVKRMHVKKRSS